MSPIFNPHFFHQVSSISVNERYLVIDDVRGPSLVTEWNSSIQHHEARWRWCENEAFPRDMVQSCERCFTNTMNTLW